jgi:hypothetical protein
VGRACSTNGENRDFVGKSEEKRTLGRSEVSGKRILKEILDK